MILPDIHGGADGLWRIVALIQDDGRRVFLDVDMGREDTDLGDAARAAMGCPGAETDAAGALTFHSRFRAQEALKAARAAAEGR